jgi:CRISPR-associated protein Csm4
MQLAEIVIQPESAFRTQLKGDTFFGHFCWQLVYDDSLFEKGISGLIDNYDNAPGIIFSSPIPVVTSSKGKKYFFSKPALPGSMIFKPDKSLSKDEQRTLGLKNRKKNKTKKWLQVKNDLIPSLEEKNFKSDKDILALISVTKKSDAICLIDDSNHNKINRLTNTTTGKEFAPFTEQNIYFQPGLKYSLLVLFDPNRTELNLIKKAIEKIGIFGYGKDASTGKGKFKIVDSDLLKLPDFSDCNAIMTTGPVLPDNTLFENNYLDLKYYFNPFIRFGKHGDIGAISGKPWKNPVILADDGAVFKIKKSMDNIFLKNLNIKGYIGQGLKNPSKAAEDFGKNCVHQAYSFCLPLVLSESE